MDNNELYHHGVLGMKWGVRRSASQLGHHVKQRKLNKQRKKNLEKARKTRAANREAALKREKKLKAGKLKPKYMTDAELNKAIERYKLEKTYKEMNAAQMSKGKKFAAYVGKNVIVPAATDIGKQVVKSAFAKGINDIEKKGVKIGDTEYKIYTNNKKKDK